MHPLLSQKTFDQLCIAKSETFCTCGQNLCPLAFQHHHGVLERLSDFWLLRKTASVDRIQAWLKIIYFILQRCGIIRLRVSSVSGLKRVEISETPRLTKDNGQASTSFCFTISLMRLSTAVIEKAKRE